MSSISLYNRRDPFAREFDALVRSAFGSPFFGTTGPTGSQIAFNPAAETVREGDDAVVRMELPGLDLARDIEVEVTTGRLVISGERRDERSEESEGRHLREIRYGRFERSFALPRHVTADAVSATYDAGVLSVRVAGVYAGTTPQKITVTAPSTVEASVQASGETPASDEPEATDRA